MYVLNRVPIDINSDLVIGEGDEAITIPAASLQCAATREQYGITEQADPVRGDDRYYWNTSEGSVVKDMQTLKAIKLTEIADARYNAEVGGVGIGGMRIKTDRESQAQLSSAFTSLSGGLIENTPWKSESGWVDVTIEDIRPIAQAVAMHVRSCFALEKMLQEELDALVGLDDVHAVIAFDAIAPFAPFAPEQPRELAE